MFESKRARLKSCSDAEVVESLQGAALKGFVSLSEIIGFSICPGSRERGRSKLIPKRFFDEPSGRVGGGGWDTLG